MSGDVENRMALMEEKLKELFGLKQMVTDLKKDLNEKITNHGREIKKLQDENFALREENMRLKNIVESMRRGNIQLQNENEENKTKIETLETTLSLLRGDISQQERKMKELEKENADLKEMNALFKTTLNQMTEDWSRKLELEKENTNLVRRRLDERNLENIELTSSNRQYCASIEALETDKRSLETDKRSLQDAKTQLENDYKVLEDVKETLVTSLRSTKRENEQLRQQILDSKSCFSFFTRKIKEQKHAADENANERLREPEIGQNQPGELPCCCFIC